MKFTAFAAVVLACCGSAFAVDSPPPHTTTVTPSGASANPVKPMSLKACNKQADAKGLTGAPRAAFVRTCRGGTKSPKPAAATASSSTAPH
jgi:hypothetical protein